MMQRYWVCNAAQEHVHIVQKKGYTQVNMGPREPLAKMNVGDWILYYSPTIYFEEACESCQQFTGIASVTDTRIYPQGNRQPDHWRRNVEFFECTPHHPSEFIGKVSFLPKDTDWKKILQKPIFEISREDFAIIAQKILIPNQSKVLLY
ncbi:hypothetical protein A3J41_02735 [candidate division TM6 bacterium RIFCSPHIGHO2_12_FULL_38_8]|nr:MAG: hypothetical protein A3J41_02735 [candidate division TM6 bacterium RIFCSPHIGHO2_12_FULL_38_8]